MSKTVTLIDPPSGWLYGFPKPIPKEERSRTLAWLVENGYPQKEIDLYGNFFFCRYFETEAENAIESKG